MAMRLRFLFQLKITILVFLLILTITYFASESISLDQFVPKRYIGHLSKYEYDYKNDNDINHYDEKFAIISGESNIDGLTIYDQTSYPFTVVTAVSKNHFCSIQSWIYYMKGAVNSLPVSRRPRVIVYDIGLLDHQNQWLSTLHEEGYFTEFRVFDFEIYPAFWRIMNGTRGEYGWKPGIVSEVTRDYPGLILWLDSGSYVMPEFLKHFERILYYYNGFFSPTSSGYITDWTHPGVFKYFNDPARKYSKFKNCNGAVIAFDSNKVGTMINNWLRCALVKDCIAPKGSNRKNHRQDQAILTYLVAREKRFCVDNSKIFGLKTHMDRVCKKNLHSYERLSNIIWKKEQAPNK